MSQTAAMAGNQKRPSRALNPPMGRGRADECSCREGGTKTAVNQTGEYACAGRNQWYVLSFCERMTYPRMCVRLSVLKRISIAATNTPAR
jgi:hypothetical protein